MKPTINEIFESLEDGQRRQFVALAKEYGLYDFWPDFADHVRDVAGTPRGAFLILRDAVVSFARIEYR